MEVEIIKSLLEADTKRKLKYIKIHWEYVEGESHESLKPRIEVQFYESN